MDGGQLRAWVMGAPSEDQREFREVVHVVLHAISTSTYLQPQMLMKGGVLMSIRYGTGRFTRDVDFSTAGHYRDFEAHQEKFLEELSSALQGSSVAADYQQDCRVQSVDLQPNTTGNYQTLRIKVGYATFGSKEQKRLVVGQCPNTIQIDYSFNESVHDFDMWSLDEDATLKVYGELTQVSEKLRAILQQTGRNRKRGQDVYDLHYLFTNYAFEGGLPRREQLLRILIEKAESRELTIFRGMMRNPDIKQRTREAYADLQVDPANPLPSFEDAFSTVLAFYEGLPWDRVT